MITAEVVLDSISEHGDRLTTLELHYPRFIHSEFMTHRVFSRNSASSRAIPVKKMIDKVCFSPAIPVQFGTHQPGMQAGPPLEGDDYEKAQKIWREAGRSAVDYAQRLLDMGVAKEVVNRLLEPFSMMTVICTATDWDNFFRLRDSELAQPEIHVLARKMRRAMEASTPKEFGYGQWHTPYIRPEENQEPGFHKKRNKVSVARCARVSYLTHNGIRDLQKDLDLYEQLYNDRHASPFEHVATPGTAKDKEIGNFRGNFTGWHQYRHFVGL